MVKDLIKPLESSFLSCEKDFETILNRLFIEDKKFARELKKLLVVNTKDCLDNPKYDAIVDKLSVADLIEQGYIRLTPKIKLKEHEEVMSYIVITLDNFTESTNPEFRDNTINFDVICNEEYWYLQDYKLRPFKIVGYIDGLLNKKKLTGIGILNFYGCNMITRSENLAGYNLSYLAYHGSDDLIPGN